MRWGTMWNSKWGMKQLAQMNIEKLYIYHHSRSYPFSSGFCRVPLTTVVILSLITPIFFFSTFQRNVQQANDPRGNIRVLLAAQQKLVVENTPRIQLGRRNGEEARPAGRGPLGIKAQGEDGWDEEDGDSKEKQKLIEEAERVVDDNNPIHPIVSDADKVLVGEELERREAKVVVEGEKVEDTDGEDGTVTTEDGHTAEGEDVGNQVEKEASSEEHVDEKMDARETKSESEEEKKSGLTDEPRTDMAVDGAIAAERKTEEETKVGTPDATVTAQQNGDDGDHRTANVQSILVPGSQRSDLVVRIQAQIERIEDLMGFSREQNNSYLISHLQLQKERCLQAVHKLTDGSMDVNDGGNIARVAEMATLRVAELKKSTLQIDKLKLENQEMRDRCTNLTDRMRSLLKERNILDLVAAKSLPKGLHCLSIQLTVAYFTNKDLKEPVADQDVLEDNSRHHYALFSDNVLAASVVIKSAISNANNPSNHVFHLVTDSMNKPAMKAWFMLHPPHPAAIEIKTVEDFSEWLTPERCPVLKFLTESKALREFYNDVHGSGAAGGKDEDEKGIKHRNPKYLSMLNHLRFYLPEIFPKLKKVVFLDDDIVIQKDLAPLFGIDLEGNVNGAVFTCRGKFHRLGHYLNFSHPAIAREFDEDACGWAYGMNIFDLDQWRKENLTDVYHKWQIANENRLLWKLGTLPPGLLTFYKRTHPLKKSWHQLGLGYDPEVTHELAENAAVVHYNGNSKPWLDIAMEPYRKYWTRYVDRKDPLISECNINVGKQSSSSS